MITLTNQDARQLLVQHHFRTTSLQGAFERLGSIQYDPLNPVGRNHDLVLQARVPGYGIGDWQQLAYRDRFIYDGWDKQASLVLMRDYPLRCIYYSWHDPRWRKNILDKYPEAVRKVLDELEKRGPLSSTDFHFQEHRKKWEGSWYGPKLTKNVLRALWHTGQVQTSSRLRGKHVYDLAARVIPGHLLRTKPIPAKKCIDWLILLRHRAMGLMRPNGDTALWSLGITAGERRDHLQDLLQRGRLVQVEVDGVIYHGLPETLKILDTKAAPVPEVRFIAPLDQLMWDRVAVRKLFGFDYVWEVYKPQNKRRWGYYVLPVMWGEKMVARFDSRLTGKCWEVHSWRWEEDVDLTSDLLEALERAVSRFRSYLGAGSLKLPRRMDRLTRGALRSGFKAK